MNSEIKLIHVLDNKFTIRIPYNVNLINKVKDKFTSKKWNSSSKMWEIPITQDNFKGICDLIEDGFAVSYETGKRLIELKNYYAIKNEDKIKLVELSKAKDADINIKLKEGQLFPYQKAGVSFIEHCGGKALVADEMGLGKTLQAIAWTLLHPDKIPILIICPSTLKINWNREFQKWAGLNSIIIDTNFTLVDTNFIKSDIYIINYDIMKKKKEILKKMNFKIIILDECHYVKNPKAQRSKEVLDFAKKIPHILALTGTPILNRPIEIYNILKLLSPENFGNYWNFAKKYCGAYNTRWGLDVTGASNINELSNLLRSTVMLRREKKDVLTELPDKTRTIIPLTIDLTQYSKVENDLKKYLIEIKNRTERQANIAIEQLAKIEYCKQEAVKVKLNSFIEWVYDFMEVNGKLVIFAHHKEYIDTLMNNLKEYNPVKIVGGMSIDDKQQSIDKFQNDSATKIIVCSLKAAGVGITLTASNYVAFLELGWTPGDHDQAEDRCHRIGIKDNVTCYYFLAVNTIEEVIYSLIQSKRKIFKELMQDNNMIEERTMNILDSLVNMYTGGA